MAIYAVQAIYAAGCFTTAHFLFREGLNLPFFSNPGRVLTGEVKNFADAQAEKMGLKKEVVVIEGKDGYLARGNTLFSGKVSITVPTTSPSLENTENCDEELDCSTDYLSEFKITHYIAHVKANDYLIIHGAVLAASLFTTFVLTVNCGLFTRYLGGLGVALITFGVLFRKAEKEADLTAMRYCSNDTNKAYLGWLQEKKDKGSDRGLRSWIFCLVNPSIDERIRYFQAHINAT
jgi:hypothetical protein